MACILQSLGGDVNQLCLSTLNELDVFLFFARIQCRIQFRRRNGSFQKFSGEIDYAGAPEKSRVQITMDASSIVANDPKLTEHLKTPDFFDVAKFPDAKFVSTEIKAGGEGGATHTVTGNLTMHGVTKSVTFPATIAVTADTASVDADFSINRKDFGINYAGAADNLIRDSVVMKLTIRANKAS